MYVLPGCTVSSANVVTLAPRIAICVHVLVPSRRRSTLYPVSLATLPHDSATRLPDVALAVSPAGAEGAAGVASSENSRPLGMTDFPTPGPLHRSLAVAPPAFSKYSILSE